MRTPVPASTYRLQLTADFGFGAATDLVPYLHRLGVDWLYLSPIFAAQPGSRHGYDVIDPTVVNPELGGRDALDALARAAHAAGLRILADIVPNHQAATQANARWQTALATREPGWFDVDWIDGAPRYRRFFDVDQLVGVRVEDESVFRATHALVFELLAAGVVDGLRVDHVDGLADPAEYLERLHRHTGGVYTVVEKILARDEELPPWPVAGTTGYEAGDALTALCIDPDGRARLERGLVAENGRRSFEEIEHESKAYVLDASFANEWERVLGLLADDMLAPALREVTLTLDVYRTYGAGPEDHRRFDRAAAGLTAHTADSLRKQLLTATPSGLATRWRQLTGPVMAKGHEDTACYRYPALLAQNEVGGDPGAGEHEARARFDRLAAGYGGLIGTSTHDSKRSEDVRARLCVLSEHSQGFETAFRRWRVLLDPASEVTPTELRFVVQTLLGAWPLTSADLPAFRTRIADYLTKALREAKQSSDWIHPNEEHERKVIECADATIADDGALLHDAFGPLVDEVMFFGALNSLSVLTWKLAMPGTADIYRGSELWDLTLVDPDNRRPVDFDARGKLLATLEHTDDATLLTEWRSGAIKLRVTTDGLRARREHPDLFLRGEYVPLDAPPGVFAFGRRLDDSWAVAIAPRFATRITTRGRWPVGAETWGDATLTLPGTRRPRIRLADALASRPVALVVLP